MTGFWVGLLPLVLLGALLGLDVVSFPQAMVSRPIVVATLGGAVAGRPLAGLLIGASLELIALETLPFGASRYPEWGSAAVVGGALLADAPATGSGALCLAVLAALVTAWVGGYSMILLRRVNAHWARQRLSELERGSERVVTELQLYGLTADLLRGAIMTAAALLLFRPLVAPALAFWSVDDSVSRAVLAGLAATVAAGAVWKLFHAQPGARWLFAGGLALGCLVLLLR